MLLDKLQPYTCKTAEFAYKCFHKGAKWLIKHNISANIITFCGLVFAIIGLNFLALGNNIPALICLIFNRICDILDGMCARLKQITSFGAFFDILADYTSFALFIWGFTLSNPNTNSGAGIFMLVCLVISAVSLLSYALISKQNYKLINRSNLKICIWGHIQNFDTFVALFLMCIFNQYFVPIAIFFSLLMLGKSLIISSKAFYILEIKKD